MFPVMYISSFNLALFLSTMFFENPIVVIEKETLLELVVSPPDSFKLYFFVLDLMILRLFLSFFL